MVTTTCTVTLATPTSSSRQMAAGSTLRSTSEPTVDSRFALTFAVCEGRSHLFQTLDGPTAGRLSGENPDYGIQALFETIEAGKYPSWTVYIVRT